MTSADRAVLLARLASTPDRLSRAALVADRRAADRAAGRRSASDWGPHETVRHLIAVEWVVWQARLEALLSESRPRWGWMEPGLEPELEHATMDAVLAGFADARRTTLATLARLSDAEWMLTGDHDTFGVLDVAGLLGIAIDHDEAHLASLEVDPPI